jgi:hypothetical protein
VHLMGSTPITCESMQMKVQVRGRVQLFWSIVWSGSSTSSTQRLAGDNSRLAARCLQA